MEIVILISADAEWQAVKGLLPDSPIEHSPFGEIFSLKLGTPAQSESKGWNLKLFHSGWGKISSAAVMQYVIDRCAPDLVVNLGTCGGFEGSVNRGDVILVEKTFVYDIQELMSDVDVLPYYASTLDLSWLPAPLPYPVRRGTLASADSDLLPEKIPCLKSRGTIAADWESAALAWVAQKNNTRLLILRGVSDIVIEQGGEVYNDIETFNERARDVMKQLFDQLPGWLGSVRVSMGL